MVTPAQQQLLRAGAFPEELLEANIRGLCKRLGVRYFHDPSPASQMKEEGLPDDIIVGRRGFLIRENKGPKGSLSPAQRAVIAGFLAGGYEVKVWRPEDWLDGTIEREIREIA